MNARGSHLPPYMTQYECHLPPYMTYLNVISHHTSLNMNVRGSDGSRNELWDTRKIKKISYDVRIFNFKRDLIPFNPICTGGGGGHSPPTKLLEIKFWEGVKYANFYPLTFRQKYLG